MKKAVFLIVGTVLLLLLTMAPANASVPIPISGTFVGTSFPVYGVTRSSGANVITYSDNQGLYISGPMVGTFNQHTNVIWHFGNPETVENLPQNIMLWKNYESVAVWHIERVFSGTVLGKSGTLTILLEAKISQPTVTYPSLEGTWVIKSGTEDLENLHGQGTWWNLPGQILAYDGQVHFDP